MYSILQYDRVHFQITYHIVLANVFVLPTFTDGCKIMSDGFVFCSSTYKLHLRLELAEHYIATLDYMLGPRRLEEQF